MTAQLKSALNIATRTHQGLIRVENQDASYTNPGFGFMAVADGLGGHQSGKLCAELTTGFFEAAVKRQRPSSIEDLFQSMKQCNLALIQHQKDHPQVNGMRTTLVCGQITDDHRLLYGWAGDSRLYVFEGKNGLAQLSRDHTVRESKLDAALTPAEGDHHILTKSLGGNQVFEPVCGSVQLSPNHIILLSTDGLTGMVQDASIERILSAHSSNLNLAADALIDAALKAGGADNVTVVLAQIAAY
ncbi:MAG: serine/threonine-protein phosphatase [Gammaproteobacteria bacterium]|jgi:serine/threonine protein phosphatase PrpC|nr:serine/threonine-protein phosphatase [Gammaproteobacteria bacterium]MBT5052006.1 serine/threonine-protein phosphatase [Gammaproteobacteria bacterium]